jgi:phosphinothricin acetyltransferase
MSGIALVECTEERHAAAILDILNEAIVHSTAVYDYEPRPSSSMGPWFAAKRAARFPVLGAEDGAGQLLGFATYGTFRAWPAYKYTVENSVYVRHDTRGRGLGSLLLGRLVEVAEERDVHVLVGGIDASNHASIALHERHGFHHTGTIRHAGYKFGRWLDLAFYQRILSTPLHPREG